MIRTRTKEFVSKHAGDIHADINDYLSNQESESGFRIIDIKYRHVVKGDDIYSYALVICEFDW